MSVNIAIRNGSGVVKENVIARLRSSRGDLMRLLRGVYTERIRSARNDKVLLNLNGYSNTYQIFDK